MKKVVRALETFTGQEVISALEDKLGRKLPNKGILAGQAVCSILRMLAGYETGIPLNDVDIFDKLPPETNPSVTKQSRSNNWLGTSTKMSSLQLSLPSQGYSDTPKYTVFQTSYRIERVIPDGAFQFIYVSHDELPSDLSNPESAFPLEWKNWIKRLDVLRHINTEEDLNQLLNGLAILGGFDINATMVAVCLTSKQLIYLPHFEQYWKSLQLEVVVSNTPFQSLVRVLKKHEEGVGYLDKDVVLLQTKLMLFDYQTSTAMNTREEPKSSYVFMRAHRLPAIVDTVHEAWAKRVYPELFRYACSESRSKMTSTNAVLRDAILALKQINGCETFTLNSLKNTAATQSLRMGRRSSVITSNGNVAICFGTPCLKKMANLPELEQHFEIIEHVQNSVYSAFPRLTEVELKQCVELTEWSLHLHNPYYGWAMYGLWAKFLLKRLKASLRPALEHMFISHRMQESQHYLDLFSWKPGWERKLISLYQSDIQLKEVMYATHTDIPSQDTDANPFSAKPGLGTMPHDEFSEVGWLPPAIAHRLIHLYVVSMKNAEFPNVLSVFKKYSALQLWELSEKSDEEISAKFDEELRVECDRIRESNLLKSVALPMDTFDAGHRDYNVSELILQEELSAESDVMSHCVRGYGRSVKDKSALIVRFRHTSNSAKLSATAEWSPQLEITAENNKPKLVVRLRLRQLRSLQNKDPEPVLKTLEAQYRECAVKYLNSLALDELKEHIQVPDSIQKQLQSAVNCDDEELEDIEAPF